MNLIQSLFAEIVNLVQSVFSEIMVILTLAPWVTVMILFYLAIKALQVRRFAANITSKFLFYIMGLLFSSTLIYGIVTTIQIVKNDKVIGEQLHFFAGYLILATLIIIIGQSRGQKILIGHAQKNYLIQSDYFQKTANLMERDAIFADLMWRYALYESLGKELSEPEQMLKLLDTLARTASKSQGFEFDDYSTWLSYNLSKIVEYFGPVHGYGTPRHRLSIITYPFKALLKKSRVYYQAVNDLVTVGYLTFFLDILIPIAAWIGFQFAPQFNTETYEKRVLLMLVGILWIFKAEFFGSIIGNHFSSIIDQQRAISYGQKVKTPVRNNFIQSAAFSTGLSMIAVSVGTFSENAYSKVELSFALIAAFILIFSALQSIFNFKLRPLN